VLGALLLPLELTVPEVPELPLVGGVVPCVPCALVDPLIESCELVSDGTVATVPELGWLVVPAESVVAVACVPFAPAAVPCVPEMEPDCVVPVSFPAVRVLLLPLLHANANAAANAMPS
jgi:hypothetical protein